MEITPCRDGSAELWGITLMMAEYSMQPTLKREWNTKARSSLLYYKIRYIEFTRVKRNIWQTLRLNDVYPTAKAGGGFRGAPPPPPYWKL